MTSIADRLSYNGLGLLEPDSQLGPYTLIARIGAGGMGEVWKAEDTRLGRTVAIKVLPAAVVSDHEAIARMKREARTAAQLNHPNVATIHAIEEVGDRLFIVMEYVEGEPLTRLIERGPMAEAEVCRIGRAVAEALAEAHAKGIVHRDIKPDNIIVAGSRVKTLDFGIAKRFGPEIGTANDPTAFLTQQGVIIGTVHYMSPEQALGKTLDAKTDLFSLGVVLYEAATGKLPFRGESVTETITKIVRDEPEEPMRLNAQISSGMSEIIHRCLRKNRDERYASASELAEALGTQMNAAPTAPYETRGVAPPTSAARPHRTLSPMLGGVGAFVLIAAMIGAASYWKRPKPSPKAATPKVAATPTATPQSTATSTSDGAPASAGVVPALPAKTESQRARPATPQKTADDHYNDGVAALGDRRMREARDAFQRAVQADSRHGLAHFRLGLIALFARNELMARAEFQKALAGGGLRDREIGLSRVGLALLDGDRARARTLVEEVWGNHPDDPEVARFRKLIESAQDRPRSRRRR